jgi:hypothetical protein
LLGSLYTTPGANKALMGDRKRRIRKT